MKKPKFRVAASSTKNPKTTFSRFIDTFRRAARVGIYRFTRIFAPKVRSRLLRSRVVNTMLTTSADRPAIQSASCQRLVDSLSMAGCRRQGNATAIRTKAIDKLSFTEIRDILSR